MKSTHSAALQEQHAHGGFIGNDGSHQYGEGEFGVSIPLGGDGSAEQAYIETMRVVLRQMYRNMEVALGEDTWNLMIAYQPIPDSQNHAWIGLLSEEIGTAGFDTNSPLWPSFLEAYKYIDQFVGALYESLPEGATLVVVSDHGFVGVDTWFYPNQVLANAGLLTYDETGEIDASASKAVYHPGSGDYIFVNRADTFKDGIVPDDEVEEVLEQARRALLDARGPDGEPIVKEILEEDEEGLHLDGPYGGHLYFQVNPGYYNSGWPSQSGEIYQKMPMPRGVHFGDPRWRPMNSVVSFTKKGSQLDLELGKFPSIDVAPTICAILGIDPPADSRGSVHTDVVKAIVEAQ